ncbi:Membrane peptidase [Actinidia chinensis var. chinensis]|uniref:Membrane peptidase n=1 Tax=Actinidia chinensis var. chinensis TaxID=1590841 RepID=A0A2R6Q944_ACTCC|nr:Membrane peptidase [Actinidia chinensis var. chinensis]
MSAPCFHSLSHRSSLLSPPNSRVRVSKLSKTSLPLKRTTGLADSLSKSSKKKRKYTCFRQEDTSSEFLESKNVENELEEVRVDPEFGQSNIRSEDWVSSLRKAADAVFSSEPWTVPWTVKTILQVMLLWISSFYLVGSWIIPFLAQTAGFRKESLTYRGQAFYSLLTDVAEGLAGIAILHQCLARFHPLPSDWFKFSLEGKWHLDVVLGCLMFPLVNRLSQVNLNLLPIFPSAPVTFSSVEQSIVARDPVAMALYAIVVSVCAPVWEEIVFRGFLLPSLTRYMPVWCSIFVSSVAFALAHFNMQRMLPLVFLGVVMGAVFARSRNLLASMLLHSLWNAFVFLDLMK